MHSTPRRGNSAAVVVAALLLSVFLVGALVMVLLVPARDAAGPGRIKIDESGDRSTEPLILACAASNKTVVEKIAADFTKETGIQVQMQFGPSQTLLAQIDVSRAADLYLPADDSYIEQAREKDLAREVLPLATMRAVLITARDNPHGISSLADLLKDDVRLSQANPEAAAIGKLTKDALTRSGHWEALDRHTNSYKTTVNDAANDVKVGAADAAVVWDVTAKQYPDLHEIAIPELKSVQASVAVTVLSVSKQPASALKFARYLAAEDKGLVRYREAGFAAAQGDRWEETPEVRLYAGSMLRPAIEATITEFERREGVHVSRIYNGCGILVGMMKAGQNPDAYFACDQEFMTQVKETFPDAEEVSRNQLVILVQKGNPKNIRNLKDLGREGLRVGIGHEKQCAMGWLTQKTFAEGGVTEVVMKNVAVQSPTGDYLVNQMQAGALDAAVAYISNAAGAAKYLDAIRIDGIPCSTAVQPYGIAKDSPHRQTMQRLLQAIRSPPSHERFLLEGFEWKAAEADKNP